jgi:hypothetical protein
VGKIYNDSDYAAGCAKGYAEAMDDILSILKEPTDDRA